MAGDSVDAAMLVAGVATAMTIAGGVPQVRRVRETGDTAGVSLSMSALSLASESGWIIYFTGSRLWSALPEAIVTLFISASLSWALRRAGSDCVAAATAATVWAGTLVVARLVGGLPAIGALLSVTYAVQLAPAVWTAWRAWIPSGIATVSWAVRGAQSLLWGTYGALRGDQPLLTLGVIGTLASAAILVRQISTRGRLVASDVRQAQAIDQQTRSASSSRSKSSSSTHEEVHHGISNNAR